jgi:hypothetical protein
MAGRGRRQARLGEGSFGKHEAGCGKRAAGENVPAGWKSLVIVHHGILSCFFGLVRHGSPSSVPNFWASCGPDDVDSVGQNAAESNLEDPANGGGFQ